MIQPEAAANREFRLEIAPAAAPHLIVPHEIRVVDGYNIYDEEELNLLTNSYGEWTCEDLNENISSMGRLDQGEVAERFLRQYFVKKLAEELEIPVERITAEQAEAAFVNPNSINAIILHKNMRSSPVYEIKSSILNIKT